MNNNKNSILNKMLKSFRRSILSVLNVRIPLKVTLFLCVFLTLGSSLLVYSKVIKSIGGKEDFDEAKHYIEVKDAIEENYIDTVNRNSLGDSAFAAMVSGLGDKWSYYMSEEEYKTYQLSSANEYTSIGMSLIETDSGGFQVVSISSDSPAFKAGLSTGMVIVSIDGESVVGLDADSVRTRIRSRLNTKFSIGVENSSNEIVVDCTGLNSSSVEYRLEVTQSGYIKIKDFEAGSGQEAIDAFEDLLSQGADSFVIDVRGNSGGLMNELQIILDYLLPGVTLFYSVDKSGHTQPYTSDSICVHFDMCVLINSETYNAAEIFAAVLQENQWASIIGEPTNGSTRTQNTVVLSDGSAIRLSTNAYLTGHGVDVAANGGVVPDMIVYNTNSESTGTTAGTTGTNLDGSAYASDDEQLMTALKLLS